MQATAFNADLGRQQFLELMVAQLRHQDPLEPVGQQEFLQQLAQFSVVEGVEQLNLQFEEYLKLQTLADGADFIGQQVEYTTDNDEIQSGTVSKVRVNDGQLLLTVDGQNVPFANVTALVSQSE